VIDVGDVDGAADDLVPLRHAGAAVGPAPAGVALAAEPSGSPLLLQRPASEQPDGSSSPNVDIGNRGNETGSVLSYPAAAGGPVGDGREADDAAVRRRGDREAGVGGVVAVGGGGEQRGHGREGGGTAGDGGGEGGRDELLGHGVELGEELLQIPHLALPGVGAGARRLLRGRRGVVGGGGLGDGHRSSGGGEGRGFWKVLGRGRRCPAMGGALRVAAATEEEEELGDRRGGRRSGRPAAAAM